MLGIKATQSGVSDRPAMKAKRYEKRYFWDSRADRGRGAYVKETRRRR